MPNFLKNLCGRGHEKFKMNEIERKKRFRQHRLRIQNATSVVESQAPKPQRDSHMEPREFTFIEMMRSLYSKGNQRTFTQSPVRLDNSAIHKSNTITTKVCSSNKWTTRSGFNANTILQNKRRYKAATKEAFHNLKQMSFEVPIHVWQRYNHLAFVKNPHILGKLLRPQIFLDLQIGHGRPLGRLVVQLFTEACPEIVLQFVRVCLAHQQERFQFTRLFVPLWLEGELHVEDKNALAMPNMEHDPAAINHGSGAGILSFPSRYLRGSKFRFISFSVSFKPIDVLNGKRIAFGKIRRGQHILDNMQNFQVTRCGKPKQDLIVTSCGVL